MEIGKFSMYHVYKQAVCPKLPDISDMTYWICALFVIMFNEKTTLKLLPCRDHRVILELTQWTRLQAFLCILNVCYTLQGQ